MSDDPAVGLNISIKKSQAEKVNLFLKYHKDLTVSRFFQMRVDDFFNKDTKEYMRDMFLYLGYPAIIIGLLLVIYMITWVDLVYYATGGIISVFFYSLFAFRKRVRRE